MPSESSQFVCHHYDHYYFCFHLHRVLECPNITFKNSWYIILVKRFSWHWNRNKCQSQGGDLVSIETEEEWNFINDEIQRRNMTKYDNRWSIGLIKKGRELDLGEWKTAEYLQMRTRGAKRWTRRGFLGAGERGVFGNLEGTSWRNRHTCICGWVYSLSLLLLMLFWLN